MEEEIDIIGSLQEDVALRVLQACQSHQALASAAQVCRHWRDIAEHDFLWRERYQQCFAPPHSLQQPPGIATGAQACWHRSFRWKWALERRWRKGGRHLLHACEAHQAWVNAVRFSSAGVVVSGGGDGGVIVWDLEGNPLHRLAEHGAGVWCCDADASVCASGGSDHRVLVSDLGSGQALQELHCQVAEQTATSVQLLQGGACCLASYLGGALLLWDLRSGQPECALHINGSPGTRYGGSASELPQHQRPRAYAYCAQLQDHMLVAGGQQWDVHDRGMLHVYDTRSVSKVARLDAHEADVFCMHLQPSRMVTGSKDGGVKLWDAAKLRAMQGDHPKGLVHLKDCPCLAHSYLHDEHVFAVRMSEEWQLTSASEDGTVRVWDASSAGHAGGDGSCCGLLPCTSTVFTPSEDSQPHLQVLSNPGAVAAPAALRACPVHAVDISETHLAAGGRDALVRVYTFDGTGDDEAVS